MNCRAGRTVRIAAAAVAVAIMLVVGGCASTKDTPAASTVPTPAPVVQAVTRGTTVDLFGIKVEVLDIAATTASGGFPRISVTMRSESTLDRRSNNPDVQLFCDEATTGGQWYEGSTWEANGLMPPGVVSVGQVVVGFPTKPGAPAYAVPSCTHPTIHVIATRPSDGAVHELRVSVPDAVITAAINNQT